MTSVSPFSAGGMELGCTLPWLDSKSICFRSAVFLWEVHAKYFLKLKKKIKNLVFATSYQSAEKPQKRTCFHKNASAGGEQTEFTLLGTLLCVVETSIHTFSFHVYRELEWKSFNAYERWAEFQTSSRSWDFTLDHLDCLF